MVLLSWFLLIVGIPVAYYISGAPPSANLLPHMLAGSGAGMIAVSCSYPLQHIRSINWKGGISNGLKLLFAGLGLVLAAQGILKAISSISAALPPPSPPSRSPRSQPASSSAWSPLRSSARNACAARAAR
eukprot:997424-Rhodomonas_salina.1